MASGEIITDYLARGSGPPSDAPSLGAAGQWALYQDTDTGLYYQWNLQTSGWDPLTAQAVAPPDPSTQAVGDDLVLDTSFTGALTRTISGPTEFTTGPANASRNGILYLRLYNSADTDAAITFGSYVGAAPSLAVPAGHDFIIVFAVQALTTWLYYLQSVDLGPD